MINSYGTGINEQALIMLLRRNNEKALEALFKSFRHSLFYYATQYLTDSQSAEDIVAESFIKLWEKRNNFDSLPAIKSFLYITVRNACLNEIKQANCHLSCHREIKYLSEQAEEIFPDHKLIKAELLHKIWQDIESLPPVRRKIFKLIFLEGFNTFEIARMLQISVDTVRVQKARALNALRASLIKDQRNKQP